jgi:hypothetical protein
VNIAEHTYLFVSGGRAAVIAEAGARSDAHDATTTVHVTKERATAERWLAELRGGRTPAAERDPRADLRDDPDRPMGGVTEAQPTSRI